MSFDTVTFWIFFAIAWAIWRVAPFRAAKRIALVLSLGFYAWWNAWYVPLIVLSAAVDFRAGAAIHAAQRPQARKRWLFVSLASNLGLLGVFKYGPFALENAVSLASLCGVELDWSAARWVIPVGISFYTFQTLSYSIDIYLRRLTPARSFWDFFLFVAFFPQLVAGPIVRAKELLPQFDQRRRLRLAAVQGGLYRVIQGITLKVVVADNIAPAVERVFDLQALETMAPATAWIGALLFSVQLFADFAGYSWVAIGLALLMGLRFPQNFNYPYISRSLSEHWNRWHITLSHWFRDYVYVSLGGNRRGRRRLYLAVMASMLTSGLWHGASWTFVAWGALHGAVLCIERAVGGGASRREIGSGPSGIGDTAVRFAQMAYTYAFWVVSLTLFRSKSFAMAGALLERMLIAPFTEGLRVAETENLRYLVLALPVLGLHLGQLAHEWFGLRKSAWLRAAIAGVLLFLLIVLRRGVISDFIYFQF